ncbi:hypothetical protein MAR_017840 [Mya arenaria]|uniref:Uncharacterized protein n=1 Tax=Mya arenaria TaxID=6604 RepID=A0ABY7ECZ6_MYAAR|nr:hypothetical protein MAR_017840 [Mya arenaria]
MTTFVQPLVLKIVSESRQHISSEDVDVNGTDAILSYGKVVLELGLIFLELCDIVKSPSRICLLCHMKYIMLVLKGHKNKTIIPADLQMEHIVRLTKGHLRSMGSNVTDKSLVKRSSAFFGMEEISNNFDKKTGVVQRAHKQKKLSSFVRMKNKRDLRWIKPFMEMCGRQSESLKKVPKNPIKKLDMADILKWILHHKMLLYYEL